LLPAPQIVHIVRKFEDIPKFLSTIISKNIIKAIIGPATYQGHGSYIQFIFIIYNVDGQTYVETATFTSFIAVKPP
jgi:hypothetical protein